MPFPGAADSQCPLPKRPRPQKRTSTTLGHARWGWKTCCVEVFEVPGDQVCLKRPRYRRDVMTRPLPRRRVSECESCSNALYGAMGDAFGQPMDALGRWLPEWCGVPQRCNPLLTMPYPLAPLSSNSF